MLLLPGSLRAARELWALLQLGYLCQLWLWLWLPLSGLDIL
jgi:hypothetical protein